MCTSHSTYIISYHQCTIFNTFIFDTLINTSFTTTTSTITLSTSTTSPQPLLQAVQSQGMPQHLITLKPAHICNWDYISSCVNAVSINKNYFTPKQCRMHYETMVVPREEGKPVCEVRRQKKGKGLYKVDDFTLYCFNRHIIFIILKAIRFNIKIRLFYKIHLHNVI